MALANEGNTSGLGYQPPWEMSEQVANYLDEIYKDNPLANIEYYTGGGYLLEPKQYLPFYADPDHNPADYGKYGGYAPVGSEDIYVANIDYAGHQVEPLAPLAPFKPDPSVKLTDRFQELVHEDQYKKRMEAYEEQQALADWQSGNIARTGLHESIHSNLFDRYEGAYPNAIAQMLKGTSELGIPASRNRYLGKRIPIGNPHIDSSKYIPEYRDAYYEQNELLTQALTELLSPRQPHPQMPANAHMGSPIHADYDYSKWHMDKPGGPMTKEGLDKFLFEKTQPFYEQILDDAEKGYIQDSIWATPPHLWGIRTKGT